MTKSKGIVETKIIPTPSTIATSDDKMSTSSIHREKITPKIPVKEFTIKKDNNNINKALKEIESNENKLSKTKNGSIEEKKEEKTIPPTITSSMVTKTRVDIIENKPKHFNEWLSAYSKNVKPSTISEPKKNIYTETMADLYIKQGNIAQAIKIYEELIELYPEKKIYFTQKITPLKNL